MLSSNTNIMINKETYMYFVSIFTYFQLATARFGDCYIGIARRELAVTGARPSDARIPTDDAERATQAGSDNPRCYVHRHFTSGENTLIKPSDCSDTHYTLIRK